VRQRVTSGTSDRSRQELESGRSDGTANEARTQPRRRRVWAAIVAAAALLALAGAARNLPLVSTHGFGSKTKTVAVEKVKTAAGKSVKPRSPHRVAGESLRRQHAEEAADDAAAAARQAGGRAPTRKRVAQPTSGRSAAPVEHAYAQQPTYVSNNVTGSASTAPAQSESSPAATATNSGPTPLPAPAVSPPKPLRSP
jgi:hypothetical protein